MTRRTSMIIGALVLVATLAIGGVGIAQAWGTPNGMFAWMRGPNSNNAGWMMNPQGTAGAGSMMGGAGNGMMGGASYQQNPATTPATGNTDTIVGFAFSPSNLQVKVGTTVTWTNQDSAPHTVTFNDTSLRSSGIMRQGETYQYTFTKTGTFTYYCAVHPYMKAQVIVTA